MQNPVVLRKMLDMYIYMYKYMRSKIDSTITVFLLKSNVRTQEKFSGKENIVNLPCSRKLVMKIQNKTKSSSILNAASAACINDYSIYTMVSMRKVRIYLK